MVFVCAGGKPAAFRHNPSSSPGCGAWRAAAFGSAASPAAPICSPRRAARWARLHNPLGACAGPDRGLSRTVAAPGPLRARRQPHHLRRRCRAARHDACPDRRSHGRDFARRVSDWFLHMRSRSPRRPSGIDRDAIASIIRDLLNVLQHMEATIEQPLGRKAMAALVRVSPATSSGSSTASGHELPLRLSRCGWNRRAGSSIRACLSLSEIGFATGFSSASHFSRSFKKRYAVTPRNARQA